MVVSRCIHCHSLHPCTVWETVYWLTLRRHTTKVPWLGPASSTPDSVSEAVSVVVMLGSVARRQVLLVWRYWLSSELGDCGKCSLCDLLTSGWPLVPDHAAFHSLSQSTIDAVAVRDSGMLLSAQTITSETISTTTTTQITKVSPTRQTTPPS